MLRLQGSGLCDLKPDRCSDQIDSYLEPNGKIENHVPITEPQQTTCHLLLSANSLTSP
jgi:hypothetical protein